VLSLRFFAPLVALFVPVLVAASAVAADVATVTTVAGSGWSGTADGPAASATFMMPSGIAVSRATGDVIVSDLAAQRIRRIRQGVVSTIAGSGYANTSNTWVPGGFADGPAQSARFNRPAGIALGAHDEIYVADEGNRAIRKIDHGVVTTIAGSPRISGHPDGALAVASFLRPHSVAVGTDGSIYVADLGVGVRRITPAGTVTTLALPGMSKNVTAVSIASINGADKLYVADIIAWIRYDATSLAVEDSVVPSTKRETVDLSDTYPVAIAPLGPRVVVADPYDNTIALISNSGYEQFLSQPPRGSVGHTGGSFSDQDGGAFDVPYGVATDRHGNVYVADAGNKRVRMLAQFSPSDPQSEAIPSNDVSDAVRQHEFRIALIGNSFVWPDNDTWTESIAAQLTRLLDASPELVKQHRSAHIYPISEPGTELVAAVPGQPHDNESPIEEYIDTYLADGEVDEVIYIMNYPTGFIDRSFMTQALGPLRRIRATLQKGHTRFGIAVVPYSRAVSPIENTFCDLASTEFPCATGFPHGVIDYSDAPHQRELAAAVASGADVFDAFQAFDQEVVAPQHRPLFHEKEMHPNPHGNEVIARTIAAGIFHPADFSRARDAFSNAELAKLQGYRDAAPGAIISYDPLTREIRGWAVDPREEAPARGVFIILDGHTRIDLTPLYGFTSDQAPVATMAQATFSGFHGVLGEKIAPGDHTFSLAVISYDGQHFWNVPGTFAFTVKS